MKAELASGEIVTLEKDCNCCVHNDPHWTYMDRVSRALNRRSLDFEGKTAEQKYYGLHGMAIEEQARCAQKIRDMQRRGIVRLIPEESDEMTDIQRQQLERNRIELLADLERKMPAPIKTDEEVRLEQSAQRDGVREKAKAAL